MIECPGMPKPAHEDARPRFLHGLFPEYRRDDLEVSVPHTKALQHVKGAGNSNQTKHECEGSQIGKVHTA